MPTPLELPDETPDKPGKQTKPAPLPTNADATVEVVALDNQQEEVAVSGTLANDATPKPAPAADDAEDPNVQTSKKSTDRLDAALTQQRKRREIIRELLETTKGNIPALFSELNKDLIGLMAADKRLTLDTGVAFAQANESFRLPSYASLELNGKSDFFGLGVAEQELLYEMVGLFKGIVVDQRRENPVEPGYRDVLKHKVLPTALDNARADVADAEDEVSAAQARVEKVEQDLADAEAALAAATTAQQEATTRRTAAIAIANGKATEAAEADEADKIAAVTAAAATVEANAKIKTNQLAKLEKKVRAAEASLKKALLARQAETEQAANRAARGLQQPLTRPTRVFHKKPAKAGYFESSYALDEGETKRQQTGIFNLGFGLSVSYSTFVTSAALRAGFSYGKEWHGEEARFNRDVTITSSFFLPKVELSFDTRYPCASDDFVAAIEEVFGRPVSEQFAQLVGVLRDYGHFVATSLTVGGRLYSTETKHIDKKTTLANEVTKYGASLQGAITGFKWEVGIETTMQKEEAEKKAASEQHERQNLRLQAIGGEGAYVNNTEQWVKSLTEYKSWGLVRFDNLVPSLHTLPTALRQKCHTLLLTTVDDPGTSIEGIRETGADFLFYQGYVEDYGRRIQPRYIVLKGSGTGRKVLTVVPGDKTNDKEVSLKDYESQLNQEWWYAPNGKIYARNSRDETEQYVLTLARIKDTNKLVITQEDCAENQLWTLANGRLRCQDANVYLEFGSANELVIGEKGKEPTSRATWQTLTGKQLNRIREVKTREKLTQAGGVVVPLLRDGQYLDLTQRLTSPNSVAELVFEAHQVVIHYNQKPHWTWAPENLAPTATLKGLYLDNGTLYVLDSANQSHYLYGTADQPPLTSGDTLELLDNGNLELLARDNRSLWESNSMIYSVLCREGSDSVLTVHHTDFMPDMSFDFISVTTQPFVGAEHQLWYLNRNRQLICKARTSPQVRMALTCEENGGLRVMADKYRDKAQQWAVSLTGTAAIVNEAYSRYLSYAEDGQIINADTDTKSGWKLVPQPTLTEQKMRRVRIVQSEPVDVRGDDKGYQYLSDMPYIHLDRFLLTNSSEAALRGLRLKPYQNRLAIEALLEGSWRSSTGWNEVSFEKIDQDKFYFSKAPVYLPEVIDKLGLIKREGAYGLCAAQGNTPYQNFDTEPRLRLAHKEEGVEKIEYVDTTPLFVTGDERLVGFGFTRHKDRSNRLALYLLVVYK